MTRSEARSPGLKHYDEGRSCPSGHSPIRRLVSTGGCVACQAAHAARYRIVKPEMQRNAKAAYKARHPERVLQHAREHYARTKEASQLRHKKWLKANPFKRREHEAARRAKAGKSERYTAADIDALLVIQQFGCIYCGKSLRHKFHVDHIVPLSKGGSNGRKNIQLLCQPCNQTKHARHPIDFARSIGRLL